jgi:uncharacterized cupin superfamily protein
MTSSALRFWASQCRVQTIDAACEAIGFDSRSLPVIMSKPITVLRDTHPLPVLDACKWEKLGDPHTVNLNAYTSEDGSKIMGTWICTPGKWYVEYVKWEYCHFRRLLRDHPGRPGADPFARGDIFVVEPGMKGTWEVVETVRSILCLPESQR